MSFRYTNSLIGVLKHRLLLESSYRDIARRKFTGNYRGVEVVCSGYGSVLALRVKDRAVWDPFYRRGPEPTSGGTDSGSVDQESEIGGRATPPGSNAPLDLDKLAESIKVALWDAVRKIRLAKEEALQRSLSHNPQMQATAELKHWYEEDANTLRPLPFEALKHEAATPWMQLVRHGKREHADALLKELQRGDGLLSQPSTQPETVRNEETYAGTSSEEEAPLASTLSAEDISPSSIPIGSVHPLFVPSLIQLEDTTNGSTNSEAVCRAQLWELSRDEQLFWERVELIRKGQVASVGTVNNRGYAGEAAVVKDNTEEKMLRLTIRRLGEITDTCVPTNFVHAADLAFYFPRFQPRSHLHTRGVPELCDAVELLQPPNIKLTSRWLTPCLPTQDASVATTEWKKARDKALALMSRGEEIMENVGGVTCAALADVIRPLYATKFELLNGLDHLPRSGFATRMDVHRLIVKQAGRLLYFNDSWDKSDISHLDTACVIVAHFIRSFCALHQQPFHAKQRNAKEDRTDRSPCLWSLPVLNAKAGTEVLNLQMVMDRLDELLVLCDKVSKTHVAENPQFRWNVPKLLLLKGILTIPLTGNLTNAQNFVNRAARTVREFNPRKGPIADGLVAHKHEHELGLFMLAQAEMAARVFDWSVDPGDVDAEVVEMFEAAAKFYSSPCNTPSDADGIMSVEAMDERRFEVDAYSSCLLSFGNFLLGAPRPPGRTQRDSPVFLPKQLFTTSPIVTVVSSSNFACTEIRRRAPMTIEVARKRAGEAFERALKLNRDLYPDKKQNPKAGWTLLSMASLYADMRDYLYATGLFASAEKTITENYGSVSQERLFVSKVRYEFLAGVGSEEEAKASAHEIVQLLKSMDNMPGG